MKVLISQSPKKYKNDLKNQLDSPFLFGQRRFTGWCLGPVFSVHYYSGKEFGRRNYPILNKSVGIVRRIDGKTLVSYFIFRGLTDPVSLILLFLSTALIFTTIHAPEPILFAIIWTILIAGSTALYTIFSEAGQTETADLERFLFSTFRKSR